MHFWSSLFLCSLCLRQLYTGMEVCVAEPNWKLMSNKNLLCIFEVRNRVKYFKIKTAMRRGDGSCCSCSVPEVSVQHSSVPVLLVLCPCGHAGGQGTTEPVPPPAPSVEKCIFQSACFLYFYHVLHGKLLHLICSRLLHKHIQISLVTLGIADDTQGTSRSLLGLKGLMLVCFVFFLFLNVTCRIKTHRF